MSGNFVKKEDVICIFYFYKLSIVFAFIFEEYLR